MHACTQRYIQIADKNENGAKSLLAWKSVCNSNNDCTGRVRICDVVIGEILGMVTMS
jgi:hypothetical protein